MAAPTFRLWGITVDCVDVSAVAAFWSALLDAPIELDEDLPGWLRIAPRGMPRLNFQPVREPRVGKVRIHLDLGVSDIDVAITRVLDLGGTPTGERHDYDAGVVVVMADPEGTQFCVVQLFGSPPR